MAENVNRRKCDLPLDKPNTDNNVWPHQYCPAFAPRENAAAGVKECWYCRHADFHLDKPQALDVGICYWPKII